MMARPGALIDRERMARVLRFGVVGVSATLVYYLTALASVQAGLGTEAAHFVAFAVSIVFSYIGQKIFTFRVKGEHKRSVSRFVLATAVIAGIQFLLLLWLKALAVPTAVLFAISSVYYPIASFIIHSLWTFRRRKETRDVDGASGQEG